MRKFILLAAAFALASPAASSVAAAQSQRADASALAPVLAHARRDADRARDQYRHPVQTLDFFQVRPGMTVVDYMPSSGWWTRVLVPYLGEQGSYIGVNPDVSNLTDRFKQFFANMGATFPGKAAEWTGVPASRIGAYNTDGIPASLNGTVDRVLIFREMHNLWRLNLLRSELLAMRALLKPDGLLGIEQHRAKANAPASYTEASMGYLRERDVIALVEAHGFTLIRKSEINANKRDPANHTAGVWTLPPGYRGVAEADKPRYQAIGESDRMTLLFRKRP